MTGSVTFFFRGGVLVEITGTDNERFFNIAANRNLMIRDIAEIRDPENRKSGDGKPEAKAVFWTTPEDFKRMKTAAKKAGVRLKIRGRYGLPFFLYRNRRRRLLAAGIVSFFLILYVMSFYIWDIAFEGNLRFTDEMLLHYMETLPVTCGMKKNLISCEELESGIRNRFPEITWVSAEIRGTRLTIRVKENEALSAPLEKDTSPCDLAAARSGTIVRVVVRNGIALVREGDEVQAGDLLVDGTIPIFDDSETLVNRHEIHADADVYARTVHVIRKMLPFTETVRARTGKVRYGIVLEGFGHVLSWSLPASGENGWETITKQQQLKLFENFYLPFSAGIFVSYEYVPYERACTEEEADAACKAYLLEYEEKLSEKGIQILGNNGKIEQSESGWQITGTLTAVENIAKEVPPPENHEENERSDECN